MKKTTKFISAALAAALCAGLLAGCNSASSSSGSTSASGSASASASASASSSTSASAESIDYSKGLAENGHIDGVTALDYVTLPADYAAIPLAAGTADVSDEDVQAQIDSIMAQYAKPEQITDRAIEDGCLLYTSDAADDLPCVDLGGRRTIKKKNKHTRQAEITNAVKK